MTDPDQRLGRAASLALTSIRLAFAPFALALAYSDADGRLLAGLVVVESVMDVYDGKIARRFGVVTPGLRRFDSITDTIFFICIAIAIWILHPDVIRDHIGLLVVFVVVQIAGYVLDFAKFGRDTSYHTWSARTFGVALFVSTSLVFWNGNADPWISVALILGTVSNLDAIAISLILPVWRHDVRTIPAALRIRHDILSS